MYSRFDSKTLHAVSSNNNEGQQYIEVIMGEELEIRHGCNPWSILGDIGLRMTYFEEGRAVSFEELLDRYERMDS
jgi:hypothetical protein